MLALLLYWVFTDLQEANALWQDRLDVVGTKGLPKKLYLLKYLYEILLGDHS